MIDLSLHAHDDLPNDDIGRPRATMRRFVLQEWPYLLMLTLVLLGVGYTGFSEAPIRGYWIALAPIVGAICVASAWPVVIERQDRIRLIWTQALHWCAVLAAMELIYVGDATRMMTAEASALSVLAILSLGTFTAGIHLPSWRIALVGLVLGLAVPAIALLERSAILLVLIVAIAAAVIVPVWWSHSRRAAPDPVLRDPILRNPTVPPDPLFDPPDPTVPRDPLSDPRL